MGGVDPPLPKLRDCIGHKRPLVLGQVTKWIEHARSPGDAAAFLADRVSAAAHGGFWVQGGVFGPTGAPNVECWAPRVEGGLQTAPRGLRGVGRMLRGVGRLLRNFGKIAPKF